MKIALCQFSPRLGDVEANLDDLAARVTAARDAGADLVLCPELALTGYRLRDLVPHVAVRLDRAGPVRDRLAELSRTVPFLAGLVEETADHRFFNAAAYFEDGRLHFVHRKLYLPTYGMFDEAMDFARGERLRAFDTCFGRAGVLICEDAWHPAASAVLAQDGATMLFVPAVSPLRGLGSSDAPLSADAVEGLIVTLARFNTMPVFYVNRCGYEEGIPFAGGSFGVGPSGAPLGSAPLLEDATVLCSFDPRQTRDARAAVPLVRDERVGLYAREFARIERERGEEVP